MATYFVNSAETLVLDWIFKTTAGALNLHLYSNNLTPSATTALGDITEVSTSGTGYAAKTLSRAGWNSSTSVSGTAVIEYGTGQVFSFTGSATVYGFYLTTSDDATLVYVERFASTRSVSNGVDLTITPKVSLHNDDT